MLGNLFGKHEDNKNRADLDRAYYARRKAYLQAKEEKRLENARAAGVRDADKLANQQPFYQKLVNGGAWLLRDLSDGAGKVNTDALFSWDEKPKRKRRKH